MSSYRPVEFRISGSQKVISRPRLWILRGVGGVVALGMLPGTEGGVAGLLGALTVFGLFYYVALSTFASAPSEAE